ncbi:MAG: hypothetical protein ACR2PK_07025 [Acidimicrobiales bacterium]
MSFRLLAALLLLAVIAAGCGGGNNGDEEAYCDLIRSGVAIAPADQAGQAAGFEELLEVAPEEVRDAVQQLRNTTRGLTEIEEVEQLFEAAFDPDAQAARMLFNQHAVEVCEFDGQALSDDRLGSAADPLNNLLAYVANNFVGEVWTTKVRYDIQQGEDASLESVTITFVLAPSGNEHVQACNALAVYLYEIERAEGEVTVVDGGDVVVRRASPDGSCRTT